MAQYRQVGCFFISAQPSSQDLGAAKKQGIRTVIDMRLPIETERPNVVLANEAGLNYVNIPVNRVALASSQIDEFERVVMRMPGPYLVHCATGARAALLTLLAAAKKNNWTAQQVFSEAGLMGFDFCNTPEYAQFVTRVTTV